MHEQDYLKRQIEQLGKVLSELYAFIKSGGKAGNAVASIDAINDVLTDELKLNTNNALSLPESEFINSVSSKESFNSENTELLADALTSAGEHLPNDETDRKKMLLERALALYQLTDRKGTVFSLERFQKTEKIKQMLESEK